MISGIIGSDSRLVVVVTSEHNSEIIMFTPDGKSLVCAANTLVGDDADGMIYLWDMEGIE